MAVDRAHCWPASDWEQARALAVAGAAVVMTTTAAAGGLLTLHMSRRVSDVRVAAEVKAHQR